MSSTHSIEQTLLIRQHGFREHQASNLVIQVLVDLVKPANRRSNTVCIKTIASAAEKFFQGMTDFKIYGKAAYQTHRYGHGPKR